MRAILACALIAAFAATADGQVRRRVPRVQEPAVWGTVGVGLFNANDVSDGELGTTWDFGRASSAQFRASLEKAVGRNASVGATGTYAHVPFVYTKPGADVLMEPYCDGCDAHMNIVTLGASFHYGGGIGLHQVIEASAGALQYRDLKADGIGTKLAPVDGNIDPYFTFAYGFGYSLNPNMQASVVQEFGLAIHEGGGLSSDQSNTLRNRAIRINLRYGFGNRIKR